MCVTLTSRAARFVRMMTRMHAAPAGAGMRPAPSAARCG